MQVNATRLLSDLRELATIGKVGTGVHRPSFTPDDIAARQWVRDRLTAAGLSAVIDNAGNVYGQSPGHRKAVLIGSHTDTVPNGGWLDGSLGVVYGIEIARAIAENGGLVGIDVASFQDEEGNYLAEYGCRIFCGEDVTSEAQQARNQQGESLLDAVKNSGVLANPSARLDRNRTLAYLEAHIEQGPRLEAEGLQVGVVTGIVGMRTYRIVIKGQANHAGTTPMAMRHDAGGAALTFGARLLEAYRGAGSPDSVWNIGNAVFMPGAANVVPSEVMLALQFRDPSTEVLDRFEALAHSLLAECASAYACEHEIARQLLIPPTPMTPEIVDIVEQAAVDAAVPHTRMPSGAGHDAMIMAKYVPTGMLFVPSIGGRSHHVSENTNDADIVAGANVMLRAALGVPRRGY